MANTKQISKPIDTIWECPDDLWDHVISPVIEALDPPAATGRKRVDLRSALNGVIYVMRTGCQWNHLPKVFGDDSSVHRTMQRWITRGVLDEIWSVLVGYCEGLDAVAWTWQSADGFMGKARFGGATPAPTPRIAGKTARNAA
jgi:putative transposase